ncbi:zinc finger BED domain-containing protein 5-like [Dermacentor variabilis]|uniref:zinc finger BED domain-containing protein 5-like n=1 Tax=Dermacentor variabilis TaxID=34621 RepID=UPI003F5B8F49
MGHLVDVVKASCDDSQIAKNLSCRRTKCAAIIKNVLGEESREELCELLRTQKFSLLVDESTDKATVKHLSLVARVMNADGGIMDAFLDLVPVSDATASSLYTSLKVVFSAAEIPYDKNLIGFAADGANVMMGAHHSVASLLQEEIPGLFIMKCVCDSFHLCASYACKTLPRGVEDLARDVFNYFLSPKQTSAFQEFQKLAEVKPHELLHPSQTRWLSLQVVVTRLLEQMPALILFFKKAATDDRLLAAEAILEKLTDPSTKLYLEFLEYVLPFFTNLNKEMQSEETRIHLLHEKVSAMLKCILECYIKRDYLEATPLSDVRYKDPAKFLPLEEIYLGAKPTAALAGNTHGLNDNQVHNFRLRCLDFFIEAAHQIYLRFPLKSEQVKNLRVIDANVVL